MNYEKLYFAFMEKYKNQVIDKDVYTEKHHIIPRHAGGDDSKENIIVLTYRQHVFAHRLLWKAYIKSSDLMAWMLMSKQEVDVVVAGRKARGRANVESGHLDSIRHLANNDIQKEKLKLLNQYKLESGLLEEYQKLAHDAWRGQNHTEEWKIEKSIQMKDYASQEVNYNRLLKTAEQGRQARLDNCKLFSENLILNAERNEEFLHKTSSRSLNVFVSSEGLEFDSPIFAAQYYGGVHYSVIENWCKRCQYGWSRKPKLKAA